MPNFTVAGMPIIGNLTDAQAFAVNQDTVEVILQSLYDSAAYPTTGIATLPFFSTGIGQGLGVISGIAKTAEDTNLTGQGGSIPNLQAYIITSIEIEVQPHIGFFPPASTPVPTADEPAFFGAAALAASINDVWTIRSTGFLNLSIGSKPYLTEGPLSTFPSANPFQIRGALANATTAAAAQYSQAISGDSSGPCYMLSPDNILLIPMQPFVATLNWATLEPVTTKARIFWRNRGQLLRLSQ